MSLTKRNDGRGKTYQRGRPRILNAPVRATTSIDADCNAVLLRYIESGKAQTLSEAIRKCVRIVVDTGALNT